MKPGEHLMTTTTTSIATTASDKPVPRPGIPTRGTTVLRDAIYIELAAKASLEMDWIREMHLSLQTPDESDEETNSEADSESEVLMFIAVDHAKPARFEPAVVKAEPGFDYSGALGGSAVICSDFRGFKFTFYIDEPCEHVTGSFVCAVPQFGILERAGLLFVGVRIGDLQSFAALTVNAAGTSNVHLSMETSAAGNGVMLELVNSRTRERMYPRFVLLPRKFMNALRRAIARQVGAPSQLPLELRLATHYGASFNSNGMADCWAAARYISVGKDCPVQRLWIRAFDNIAVVDLLDSEVGGDVDAE
jgi:hypothetical protein